ncbi:MAG: M23 family metallopeptidase [Oscillospiraceae bacterium]|nr:M23 family metallopeptidase [Oscillospiraceae bacterium]
MKQTTKLFLFTAVLIALAWGCFAGYEFVSRVKITGDMEVRVQAGASRETVVLDAENRDLLDEILESRTDAVEPERYTDLVMVFRFYRGGEDEPKYEIPMCRLADGTNEFVLRYPDGKVYLADTRTVLRLLTGGLFDGFFEYITSAPTLTVRCDGGEMELHCVENGWQYRKIDNSIFLDGVIVRDSLTQLDLRRVGSLSGEMSLEADHTVAQVLQNGVVVYEGTLGSLTGFRPDIHGMYQVRVTAEWYDSLLRSYSGVCTYEFELNCILPTAFRLASETVGRGGVAELIAEYVEDPGQLSAESALGEIHFYQIREERYGALLPIAMDAPVGEQEILVSSGEKSETLTFRVTAGQEPEAYVLDDRDELERMQAWQSWIGEISEGLSGGGGEKLWKGPFRRPVEGQGEPAYATPFLSEDEEELFVLDGTVYDCDPEETVYAAASGRVVYAGFDDDLGGVVVIDHGLGVQSWYIGLGEVIVATGDVRIGGDAVGSAGENGMELRVLFSGTAVDPEPLYQRELLPGE